LFGCSSEKIKTSTTPQQSDVDLFNEFELCAEEVETEEPPVDDTEQKSAPKKRAGRKPLPRHLPRKVAEHDLSAEEKECLCGTEMTCIGQQVNETLHYKRAEVFVVEHHCKKYACKTCNAANKKNPDVKAQLKTASKPAALIPKSMASPSLLSHIVVAKFCDHLPLYRQESQFKRLSIALSRQTMSTWMLKVGEAIIPLVNLLQDNILEHDVAFADETTVQVLKEPGRRPETKSYMWCFIGGPPDQRSIIYQYHPSRKGDVATTFFTGYEGGLHCDGYAGYGALLASPGLTGVNCWAHVRRKFIEAQPNGKAKGVSGYVIKCIRALYQLEAGLKEVGADTATIKAARQAKAKPLLEELKRYLDNRAASVLPKSKLGGAVQYTRKRWPYLITYLEDGRYEIDNNRTERAIKPFVMGRKAWLFANSVGGAHTSARLFSLIETAKAHQLNPLDYLEYLFKELPTCQTLDDYEKLLPWHVTGDPPNLPDG
jgi:transposase